MKMRHLASSRMIAVACAVVFPLLCQNTAIASAVYGYKMSRHARSKPTDSITVLAEEKRTGFLITDSFGIGRATLFSKSGRWPKAAFLRFQYEKGRGFQTLEGLNITTARLLIQGDAQTSGKMRFYLPDHQGKFNTNDAPAGEINVLVEKRKSAIEVLLPPNLFVGSGEVAISWVDAYR